MKKTNRLRKSFRDFLEWLKQCPILKRTSITSHSTTTVKQNMHKDDARRPMSEKELFDRTLNEQYGPEGDGPEWPQVRI